MIGDENYGNDLSDFENVNEFLKYKNEHLR